MKNVNGSIFKKHVCRKLREKCFKFISCTINWKDDNSISHKNYKINLYMPKMLFMTFLVKSRGFPERIFFVKMINKNNVCKYGVDS